MEDKEKKVIKCVVVGDGAVGKTAMMLSYMTSTIPTQYQPTVVDTFSVNITVEEEEYTLELFDTAGQEDFDKIRSQSFVGTDVFLVCFSTISKVTLENVKVKAERKSWKCLSCPQQRALGRAIHINPMSANVSLSVCLSVCL